MAPAGATRARPRDVEYAIRQFVGEAAIETGRVVLDLPPHSDAGTSVPITIGFEPQTGEAEVPRALHVLVDGNPRPHVVSVWLAPECGRAQVATRIRLESAQTVTAIAEARDGRVWRGDQEITVNFGACADVGSGSDTEIREFKPVSRVSVPPTAKRGDIVAIRTVISHPMETGLRLNQFNTWIPMRIIEQFTCRFAGRELFRARPYPAVATNPYFAFLVRAETSGTFAFEWIDTDGSIYTNRAPIEVA
ncbi:MAG: thiosulfate oxidation carrier complex protein SoxZ [Alphaproteobacteria bacterium]|nr:thiosulfate oxidation carrier complex protein SoxZ [Alphaproteobacteria bacterium]